MTLTSELKILNDKIKANQAQCDLDREAAKISSLSSKELDKYEYLTDEDLGYKPEVLERAKFEYSPLGGAFNLFTPLYLDDADKTDKQPDTTDMPDFESENLLNKGEIKKDKSLNY